MIDLLFQLVSVDQLFTFGLFFLSVFMVPTILTNGRQVPPLWTSIPTTVIMVLFTLGFAELGLWWSTALEASGAVVWATVVTQTIMRIRGSSNGRTPGSEPGNRRFESSTPSQTTDGGTR